MPDFDGAQLPDGKSGWFSKLTRRTQAFLLSLLMFAVSAALLVSGIEGWRSGVPSGTLVGRNDWANSLLVSAGCFVIAVMLLGVALGLIRFPKKDGQ